MSDGIPLGRATCAHCDEALHGLPAAEVFAHFAAHRKKEGKVQGGPA